jgi:hypothetical protein
MRRYLIAGLIALAFAGAGYGTPLPPAPASDNHSPWAERVRANRAIALRMDAVYRRYDTALAGMGIDHVRAGRQWHVNPFFVGAIEAIESTLGRNSCGYRDTHNAWGFLSGGRCIEFASWRTGIYHVTRTLRVYYIDRGLTSVYAIGRRYCPPSDCPNDSWSRTAVAYMHSLYGSGPGILFKAAVRAVNG